MLRLLVLTSLIGVFSLAPAARADAEACRSDLDVVEDAARGLEPPGELASRVRDESPVRPPLEAPREPLSWCETPDDPQCAPASAPSEGPQAAGAPLATLPGAPDLASPRSTDGATRSRFAERRPRDGVRGLPYRPPR